MSKIREEKNESGKINKEGKKHSRGLDIIFVVVITLLVIAAIYVLMAPDDNEDVPYSAGADDNDLDETVNIGINVGQTAPNFSLKDTDSGSFTLADYRGSVVILDFMATWCPPCIDQMDYLKDIRRDYYEKGVRILSIDVDDNETREMLADFKDLHNLEWRFAYEGRIPGNTYGAPPIPTLYIIDQEGIIVLKEVGVTGYTELSTELDKLV